MENVKEETVLGWVDDWLSHLENDRNMPYTTVHQTYKNRVGYWLDWCRDHSVDVLHPDLGEFYKFARRPRRTGGAPAVNTVKNDLLALKSFYRWLCDFGHLDDNPMSKVVTPKIPQSKSKAITDQDWIDLWNRDLRPRCRQHAGWCFYLGLRRQEAADLNVSDVSHSNVHIMRKGGSVDSLPYRKLGQVITNLLIQRGWEEAQDAYDEWLSMVDFCRKNNVGNQMGYPLNKHGRVDGNYFYKDLRLAGEYVIHPHSLRHSFVTNMAKWGATIDEIAMLVGHRSVDTTRTYLDSHGNLAERLLTIVK